MVFTDSRWYYDDEDTLAGKPVRVMGNCLGLRIEMSSDMPQCVIDALKRHGFVQLRASVWWNEFMPWEQDQLRQERFYDVKDYCSSQWFRYIHDIKNELSQ